MRIDFNPAEVEQVHNLLAYVCGRAPGENEHLETALRKLRRVGRAKFCGHCRSRMSRRKDGICDPCNTYRSDRGHLPPHEVLTRRAG